MIEYVALVSAFLGGLKAVMTLLRFAGVPIPAGLGDAMMKGIDAVIALLQSTGCQVDGCPKPEEERKPLPDEAEPGRDAYHVLSGGSVGIPPKR